MHSSTVIHNAIEKGPGIKIVAAEMGVSTSLLYKWCEPDGPRAVAPNPLDRIAELMRLTRDPELVNWVCLQAGGSFVPNPGSAPSGDHHPARASQRLIKAFSELLETISDSIDDDNSIDDEEARGIRTQWEALKRTAEQFVTHCEQNSGAARPAGR